MNVWVLQGSCGDYPDRTDWVVAVFATQEAADAYSIKCIDWSARCKEFHEGEDDAWHFDFKSPFDPRFPAEPGDFPSYWVTKETMDPPLEDHSWETPKKFEWYLEEDSK